MAEKMIRKIRAGMMPPPGAKRPDEPRSASLAAALETRIDAAASATPNPGWRPFQRLNRAEYARAVQATCSRSTSTSPAFLPADTISAGFDNVADVQTFSPTLMEGYLRAASRVTALAVGDSDAESGEARYRVPKTASQLERVEGAPFGTRGGVSVMHTFPADGEYVFRMELHGNADGFLFGGPATGEQVEVSIDGVREALVDIDPRMADVDDRAGAEDAGQSRSRAGPQRVTAAFIQRFDGPVNDLIAPIDHTLADTQIGVAYGITTLPHLKDLAIVGPQKVTGMSDTPSRRKIFVCRPTAAGEEQTCAARIVRDLATQAFRRPVTTRDFDRLMTFYNDGRAERRLRVRRRRGDRGDPRQSAVPVPARAGAGDGAWRGSPIGSDDLALASRLSFFLWGSGPDAALMKAATAGTLSRAGRARPAGPPHAGRSALRRAGDALWRAVAAPRRRRANPAGRHSLSRTSTARSAAR